MTRAQSGYVLATTFLSGAAVMVVELTAVRLLQPFFGSTNYVWANVIAVVLAALALGYWFGGRLAQSRGTPRLYFGLLAAGACLVALTAPAATPVAQWLLPMTAELEGVVWPLVKGSLAASLILFAPSIAILGMVSPLAIRLLQERGAARAAGGVFALSTVGSIAGTYGAMFWLFQNHGSRASLLIAAGVLLVPAVGGLLLFSGRRGGAIAAGATIVTSVIVLAAPRQPDRGPPPLGEGGTALVRAERETPYQYVTVREDVYPSAPGRLERRERLLTINEGVYTYHSFEVIGKVLTESRYYDDYSMLPILLDVPDGEELRGAVIGLACGVTPHQWKHFWGARYRLSVDGAEIDPVILGLGREYFHLPAPGETWLRAYTMDGRHMLAALSDRTYHMIAIDAFANELYIPFHLGTREFFRLCRDRLVPGGVLAMNVYADRRDAPVLRGLEDTLADAFGSCISIQQTWGGNFLLVARRGDAPPDVRRLASSRVTERFGSPVIAEWDGLVALAERVPQNSVVVPKPATQERVLTDDFCPLEFLTDEFLWKAEKEILGQ